MKVRMALLMVVAGLLLVTALSACAPTVPTAATVPPPTSASVPTSAPTAAVAGGKKFTIGIARISFIALIANMHDEMKKELAREGFVEGKNVTYVEENAQGDMNNVPLVAKQIVQRKPDVIVAGGTPMILAIQKETSTIPVVFGAMTDPVASGVVKSVDHPGTNFTGTSDWLAPAIILDQITQVLPKAQKIGLIGNIAEQNTQLQIKAITDEAQKRGMQVVTAPTASTNDILPAAQSLKGRVDAVILPSDATLLSAIPTVAKAISDAGLPLFVTQGNAPKDGALLGIGVDYGQLGTLNGKIVAEILRGKSPADIPVVYGNTEAGGGIYISVNTTVAKNLNITLPDSILNKAVQKYQ
ncbi:MAG: ABC transporter substrate-binding protein [Chloroflexi bacterium]|nr:ABC transporter substrate-binding protein [Chloroflexota bacterium]